MEHLAIKFNCPKHKEDQLATIRHIRTNLMMYTSFLKKGDKVSAEAWLNSAVTTMDVLVALNQTYHDNKTGTFEIVIEDLPGRLTPVKVDKTKRIQFWKRSA